MAPATPIVLYLACSLDGFIAAPDGSVAWLDRFSAGGDYSYAGFLAGVGALVMGSRTYEQALGFGGWPYARLPCFVPTSRTLPVPDGAVIRFRRGDDLETLATEARTAAGDRVVWLVGGAALARSMLDKGLVEMLDLAVMPVLLGTGVPLFVSGTRPYGLALRESRTHTNGVVQLQYKVG
jgi:dihydrofolate reductase